MLACTHSHSPPQIFLAVTLVLFSCGAGVGDAQVELTEQWKRNGLATPRYEITGTEDRNNPLRQALKSPYAGDELFVRYRIRYDASTIDTPLQDEGEFFVLWLDQSEGNDKSTHSNGIPNIGLHVSGDKNHFMIRYNSGQEKFSRELAGDRDYLVVARLWKSTPGEKEPFDQLDFWIDPAGDEELSPDASVKSSKAIASIGWIGFSTGRKTEVGDRIEVWDIGLSESWREILRLPPEPEIPEPVVIPVSQRTIDFKEHVFPVLKSRCFKCHAGEDPEAGVRLDVLDELINHTAPRDAENSRLIHLIAKGEMPPKGKPVAEQDLKTLKTWIDEGLAWDEKLLPTPVPTSDHWAFQPIIRPEVPKVRNQDWVRTPVDAFIAREHAAQGIVPAPVADRATLLRRMSLDLRGLPPVASEISDPDAAVEQFLNSRAYGERWGRHWLDVARWAESNGYQHNRDRPYAWRYRDWVVDAFQSDKPYDEFIREQLAGDEFAPVEPGHIVATGFLAAARYSGNELDKEIQRNDILVDLVNTTSKAFLGLTMECAQCHTHKFDPLTIRDYYRFQAFFAQGQPGNVVIDQERERAERLISERWRIFDTVHQRLVEVRRKRGYPEPIYIIPKSVVRGMKPEEKVRFTQLEQQIAALEQAWSFYSPVSAAEKLPVAPHDMRWPLPRHDVVLENMQSMILVRGDAKSRGPGVSPGWPAVFGPTPDELEHPRSALAEWMTSPDNPLTARVWVNRIWQWHFGTGLVETSGDFGTQGTEPTHPQLLDWLAAELIDSGWSTKHIHRLILGSSTYRQSSAFSAENSKIDPSNNFYWRWTPRRLEAEAIRDSILHVSGQLETFAGGPSLSEAALCRSLYLKQKRDDLPDQQMLFDTANGIVSCSRRRVSTSALQPLWLLNSDFIQAAAQQFAERAMSVEEAVRIAYGREPGEQELQQLQSLVEEYGLSSACLVIMNSNEFLYVP